MDIGRIKKIYERIGIEGLIATAKKGHLYDEKVIDEEIGLIEKYFPEAKSVLEIGSGVGRLAQSLIEKYDYTGIELMPKFVDYCKKNFPLGKFLSGNFFDYKFDRKYDCILIPFTTINHFPFDDQEKLIVKARSLLNTNGVIIANVIDLATVKMPFRLEENSTLGKVANFNTKDFSDKDVSGLFYILRDEDLSIIGERFGLEFFTETTSKNPLKKDKFIIFKKLTD